MKNQIPAPAIRRWARFCCLPLVLMAISSVGCAMRGHRGAAVGASATFAPNLKTFGAAGKEGLLYADHEAVLFEHAGPACLTHMWFGGSWPGYDRTEIRFYVDGEATPSIDMQLFLGHGIGWADSSAPWGTERLGKTGEPSGLYNTYPIPFSKSLRVTRVSWAPEWRNLRRSGGSSGGSRTCPFISATSSCRRMRGCGSKYTTKYHSTRSK